MDTALISPRQRLLQRMRSKQRHAACDIVALTLRGLGVTHVYGVGGTPMDTVLAACARAGLRVIGARHQQGAVLMSLAHNYVSGGLSSVVIVSAGPAVTNCTTGLLIAHDNLWPLLVLAGRRSLSTPGGFQALDAARLFAPITRHAGLVECADALATSLIEAAGMATGAPHGPVYLDLAEEAIGAEAGFDAEEVDRQVRAGDSARSEPARLDPALLHEAASLLLQARRPALLIGKGARWSQPTALLRRLVDEHAIAFATSPMGRGLLPDDHPRCAGAARSRMLAGADLVLVVGARLDWTLRFGAEISPRARIIRIDVDPAEAAGVLGRGIGLPGDAASVLRQLLEALEAGRSSRDVERDWAWFDELSASCTAQPSGVVPPAERGLLPMSPYEWLAELGTAVPEDAITVLDGNIVMATAQRMLPPVRHPARRLTPGTNGCMGVGIPFAIGAKLARPDLPVIAIVGDFAFGLSAIELETAVRHRVPVVVAVANNAGSGGATRQRRYFPQDHPERVLRFGADVRHDLTMHSFGGRGLRIDRPGQIAAALTQALACGEPVCLDVLTNENTALSAVL